MKICLETSTFRARFAGIAYYTWFLSTHLLEDEEVMLYGFDGRLFGEITHLTLKRSLDRDATGRRSTALYSKARQIAPIRALYRHYKATRYRSGTKGYDLFHAMNFMPPSDVGAPVLPLVHDLSHERYPQTHPSERVAWLRGRLRNLGRYPLVNTLSDFSAQEIAEFYGYPREQIRVTRPGVNPIFRRPADPDAMARLAGQGLEPGSYFLTVGTIEPRKNHGILIEAYARLPEAFRREYPLVFVGQPGWGRLESNSLETLRSEGSVRFTGYLDETALRACYAGARALLFPTLYEGFGIPVAEAMAAGLTVVISDIPIMHEVAGPVGRYVPPLDPEAWAEAVLEAAERSPADRAAEADQLMSRSEIFTWEKTALQTAAVYREVLG